MNKFRPSERTSLLPNMNRPQYVLDTYIGRDRKKRLKQFQCCICVIFLSILLIALIVTVAYSINNSEAPDNSTTVSNETNNSLATVVLFTNNWPLSDFMYRNQSINDNAKWKQCMQAGESALKERDNIEKYAPSLPLRSPSYRHQKVVATSQKARHLARIGYIEEFATRCMHRNPKIDAVRKRICNDAHTAKFCESTWRECNIYQKYRSYNGSCNNLKYPEFYGVSYKPFRRALPPDYADGVSKPRIGKNGLSLPSARTVSLEVHRPYSTNDIKFSVMLAVWGQFLDHDITATALSQKSNGSTISCCDGTAYASPECFPVHLDQSDPFSQYNVTCMEFVRSAGAPTCCLGPREQLNQVTSFIDASVVYGVDEELVRKLRSFQNGTLKMYVTEDGRSLLPPSDDLSDGCNRESQEKENKYCFLTGDARANENLHLTSMHLVWARQHNLLASKLSELNPHWGDERIFQEARRIVGAQMQHITYNEFLPILLGRKLMKKFDLMPQREGYFLKYNNSIQPNIANNFATAAFRFAHSIIPGLMKLLANDNSSAEFIQMHKMLFNPFELYNSGTLDKSLKGAINTSIEANDAYFSSELKSHLFERTTERVKQPKLCGLDLVSLNIQRGRDHGLPGYSLWRKHCGLTKPKNFNDLKDDINEDSLTNIKAIYRSVDEIDLYTGALSEQHIHGSILGPTLTCLILDQFVRIKYGDRFWYETPQEPQAFAPQQLNEVRKTSLANVICDNSDSLDVIQPQVMKRLNRANSNIPCENLDRPSLILWKENLSHLAMHRDSIDVLVVRKNL